MLVRCQGPLEISFVVVWQKYGWFRDCWQNALGVTQSFVHLVLSDRRPVPLSRVHEWADALEFQDPGSPEICPKASVWNNSCKITGEGFM
jgi:hypothetical protein